MIGPCSVLIRKLHKRVCVCVRVCADLATCVHEHEKADGAGGRPPPPSVILWQPASPPTPINANIFHINFPSCLNFVFCQSMCVFTTTSEENEDIPNLFGLLGQNRLFFIYFNQECKSTNLYGLYNCISQCLHIKVQFYVLVPAGEGR